MGRRIALLIATSKYVDGQLRRLRAPVEEAKELRQLLLDPEVGSFDEAEVAHDESKAEIERRIELLFNRRSPDDLVLLYLSCHGIKNDHNRLFFATTNTLIAQPNSTAVHAGFVQRLLDESEAGAKVVLLDCCYSGAFSKGHETKSAGPVDLERELLGRGTYVITATDELEYAFEDDQLVLDQKQRYSIFTGALIEGISTGDADFRGKGFVSGDDIYQFLYERLHSDGRQTPTRLARCSGDFVFSKVRDTARNRQFEAVPPGLFDVIPQLVTTSEPEEPISVLGSSLVASIGAAPQIDASFVPLSVDLTNEHLCIVGQLFSGKSTVLRTVLTSLIVGRSTDRVQFYCIDADERIGKLRKMAHVREVISPFEVLKVKRMLDHLEAVIGDRRKLFRDLFINSHSTYRAMREAATLPAGLHADVFLVIDGWDALSESVPEVIQAVKRIARDGLGFGVHVIVTARSWHEIPDGIVRLLLARIELLLETPNESRISAELAQTLPARPLSGIFDGNRFMIVLNDAENSPGLNDAVDDLVAKQPAVWLDQVVGWSNYLTAMNSSPIAVDLFELLGLEDPASFDVQHAWRLRPIRDRLRVPIGVGESGQPVELDIKESAQEGMGPHGLCIGATGSGNTGYSLWHT